MTLNDLQFACRARSYRATGISPATSIMEGKLEIYAPKARVLYVYICICMSIQIDFEKHDDPCMRKPARLASSRFELREARDDDRNRDCNDKRHCF